MPCRPSQRTQGYMRMFKTARMEVITLWILEVNKT
jgi:hypothetical protein